jgi:hypothetical protein
VDYGIIDKVRALLNSTVRKNEPVWTSTHRGNAIVIQQVLYNVKSQTDAGVVSEVKKELIWHLGAVQIGIFL